MRLLDRSQELRNKRQAVGFIEAEGLPAAIAAADAAVKSANVYLISRENSRGGGYMTIKVTGEVGAVKAAIEAAKAVSDKVHGTHALLVLPRPAAGLQDSMIWNCNEYTTGIEPPENPEPPVPPVPPVPPTPPAPQNNMPEPPEDVKEPEVETAVEVKVEEKSEEKSDEKTEPDIPEPEVMPEPELEPEKTQEVEAEPEVKPEEIVEEKIEEKAEEKLEEKVEQEEKAEEKVIEAETEPVTTEFESIFEPETEPEVKQEAEESANKAEEAAPERPFRFFRFRSDSSKAEKSSGDVQHVDAENEDGAETAVNPDETEQKHKRRGRRSKSK